MLQFGCPLCVHLEKQTHFKGTIAAIAAVDSATDSSYCSAVIIADYGHASPNRSGQLAALLTPSTSARLATVTHRANVSGKLKSPVLGGRDRIQSVRPERITLQMATTRAVDMLGQWRTGQAFATRLPMAPLPENQQPKSDASRTGGALISGQFYVHSCRNHLQFVALGQTSPMCRTLYNNY